MVDYCLYPNQCGIGQDCSECYQKRIAELEAKLAEVAEFTQQQASLLNRIQLAVSTDPDEVCTIDSVHSVADKINTMKEKLAAAEKGLADADNLLCLARGAARKIRIERKRGASYYHAEVDWLVNAEQDIQAWIRKNRGILLTPEIANITGEAMKEASHEPE